MNAKNFTKTFIKKKIPIQIRKCNYLKKCNTPKLLISEHNSNLTKHINESELKEAIFQMENDKSPGIYGIPVEFYKHFYDLKNDFLNLYSNILSIENLQKQ